MGGIGGIGNIAAILLPLISDGLAVRTLGRHGKRHSLAVSERQRFGLCGETKSHRRGNAHRVLASQIRFDQCAVLCRKLALENDNFTEVSPEKTARKFGSRKNTSPNQQTLVQA